MLDDYTSILDYRRHVAALYAAVREGRAADGELVDAFRRDRDRLLGQHPHTPLPRARRQGPVRLAYYPHDPELRFTSPVVPDPQRTLVELDGLACERVGWVEFAVHATRCRLALFWIRGYAGGLFLPFTDATTGAETAATGRYVWDSLKGADLGFEEHRIVVDFNYACHPSSAYDPALTRPMPPAENRLPVAIRAGERLPKPDLV